MQTSACGYISIHCIRFSLTNLNKVSQGRLSKVHILFTNRRFLAPRKLVLSPLVFRSIMNDGCLVMFSFNTMWYLLLVRGTRLFYIFVVCRGRDEIEEKTMCTSIDCQTGQYSKI